MLLYFYSSGAAEIMNAHREILEYHPELLGGFTDRCSRCLECADGAKGKKCENGIKYAMEICGFRLEFIDIVTETLLIPHSKWKA